MQGRPGCLSRLSQPTPARVGVLRLSLIGAASINPQRNDTPAKAIRLMGLSQGILEGLMHTRYHWPGLLRRSSQRRIHQCVAGWAHASSPHSVALMQLRFTSFAVVSLRRDFHPQDCAHAGRTRKSPAEARLCTAPPAKAEGLCVDRLRQYLDTVLFHDGEQLERHATRSLVAGFPLLDRGWAGV